ncbi:MAG: outer membrane lipoprotein-sorting protein [Opitutaceae bacterium]|nr:outer membrane lipoprotein-sorting protein [Opitutaceae bacterium]
MSRGLTATLALSWRAFFVLTLAGSGLTAAAAPAGRTVRPSPTYVQIGKPDQAEGARILRSFRGMGVAGDFYLDFKLQVRPRRGAEREIPGRLWGGRNELGAVSRISLTDETGAERRLLLQNGAAPAAWRWTAGQAEAATIALGDLFAPLVPETQISIFDLQMPYLYWEEFVFEGVSKIRGRPAHTFLLYPPADFLAAYPGLSGVRVHLDTQFGALVQSELLDERGRVFRSLAVLDLKKVGEQWMVKSIDLRDERSRDKTRFLVTAAALNLDLAGTVFTAAGLPETIARPAMVTLLGP